MISLRALPRPLVVTFLATLSLALIGCEPSETTDAPRATVSSTAALESFRYRLTMELEDSDRPYRVVQEGEVILPDREHATQSINVGSWHHNSERLVIGGREWLRGDLPWIDLDASPMEYISAGGSFSVDALADIPASEETINGIRTRRYELGGEALWPLVGGDTSAIVNPDGPLTATLWVAPDLAVPVAIELIGESGEGYRLRLRLEVYDMNASDIAIEQPAGSSPAAGR